MAVLSTPLAHAAPADPFTDCRRQFAEKPQAYDSAYCFYTVTQQQRLWDQGVQTFTTLMREYPDHYFLPLAFGHVQRERDPAAAEALYRRAADGFRAARHAEGEILARGGLRNFLYPKGRVDEANAEMTRVAEIAATVDDPLINAQVWTLQASHIQDAGGDLGLAYGLLKQAERGLFPAGSYRLKRTTLSYLGLVVFRLGRHDEAVALFERLEALASSEGDAQTVVIAQYNLLNALSLKETLLPTPGAKERLLHLADRALAASMAVQNRVVVSKTHRTIAALLANDPGRRADALRHLDGCLEIAAAIRRPQDEVACAWLQASLLQPIDPVRARAAQMRALDATEQANNPLTNAYSAGRHMQFSWQSKPRADAIRDSLAAIDAIETLRSLQDDGDSSAELFSFWTLEYYWLAGRLLQDAGEGDLDLAFAITERMRARSLLDVLERSQVRLDPKLPAAMNRRALLKEIASLQRVLMDPTLSADARQDRLVKLEHLEQREREARRQIAVASKRSRAAPPSFSTLRALQSALADDEAILSFQIGISETYEGDFGGGAWLLALTRRGRSLYRIKDRGHFAPMVPVFNGLLSRQDGVERPAAARLYGDVFGGALEQLPPGVRRLIVIPDGPLQSLPFDALRAAPDAAPLAARYELVVAPSATLWLHWRTTATRPALRRALAFADPAFDAPAKSDAPHRQAVLDRGLQLGRLPYAQRESRSLERHVGGVQALVGRSASEHALKRHDLQQYELLHFAAHAVSDGARPERSAVLLSPGADSEDGLLQSREIQELDLAGRIVVLSACQTAAGAVLNGEGVLSLARAFFEAGARAVIGTRWPIRDEDAAVLFDAFYRRLGEGASLSDALAHAKLQAIAGGRPAATWASLELLGDGSMRPFSPVPRVHNQSWSPSAGLAFVLLSILAWTARAIAARRIGRLA